MLDGGEVSIDFFQRLSAGIACHEIAVIFKSLHTFSKCNASACWQKHWGSNCYDFFFFEMMVFFQLWWLQLFYTCKIFGGLMDLGKSINSGILLQFECVCWKFMMWKSVLLRLLIKHPNVFHVSSNGQKMTFSSNRLHCTVLCIFHLMWEKSIILRVLYFWQFI